MNAATNISFDSTVLSPRAVDEPATIRPVQPSVRPVAGSLWYYTLEEDAFTRRERIEQRVAYVVLSLLSIASIAFAVWQTCALMSGGQLQNAVATLMR